MHNATVYIIVTVIIIIALETGDHLDTVAYVLNTAVTSLDSAGRSNTYTIGSAV